MLFIIAVVKSDAVIKIGLEYCSGISFQDVNFTISFFFHLAMDYAVYQDQGGAIIFPH